MLTTLMEPSNRPPIPTVAARIIASSARSQSIGSQRRCVIQNSSAMISAVPATERVKSRCIPAAISETKTGLPV